MNEKRTHHENKNSLDLLIENNGTGIFESKTIDGMRNFIDTNKNNNEHGPEIKFKYIYENTIRR